jgi:hypothetical protein
MARLTGRTGRTKKDQSMIASLDRIGRYLPNTTLDPLSRVKFDDKGRLWVDEDTILIVLREHLIIEHELVDICDKVLPQPDALPDRLNFVTRLRLVRALLGDDGLSKVVYDILRDLNRIRNKLAHVLDPKDLHDDLRGFFKRFSEFQDIESVLKDDESVPERLNSCITVLCGMLESIKARSDPNYLTNSGKRESQTMFYYFLPILVPAVCNRFFLCRQLWENRSYFHQP